MNAGRELDALVAEKVVGATWKPNAAFAGHGWLVLPDGVTVCERGHGYDRIWDSCPHYSTDIAAAWTVVEKMTDRGVRVVIRTHAAIGDGPRVEMFGGGAGRSEWLIHDQAETVPLAICRAALAAVEVPA